MARKHPITAIGNAIVATIRAARATYSPIHKLVEYDEFWQSPATKGKLDARLPGTFVQFDGGTAATDMDDDEANQECTVRFRVNHIFQIPDAPTYPTQATDAASTTMELFSLDGFQLANFTPIDGCQINACVPTDFGMSDELMVYGLGWVFVSLEVSYTAIG